MQFAIDKLGFTPDQIIIHGWSIGGFPASWVAMNFPDIKAVVSTYLIVTLVPRLSYSVDSNRLSFCCAKTYLN